MVKRLGEGTEAPTPVALEARLRRIFPRAVVRAREISGEPPAWYIYRDGRWRGAVAGSWWEASGLPRLRVTREGWVAEANATALGLLEIESKDLVTRRFTDFVVPGTLADSLALFDIVAQGNELTATVLLRPSSGHVIAVDLHARRDGDSLLGVLRLADDVEASAPAGPVETRRFAASRRATEPSVATSTSRWRGCPSRLPRAWLCASAGSTLMRR